MLAWFFNRIRPPTIILSLGGPHGERFLGQACANLLLRDQMKNIYSSPKREASHQMCRYLDGLRLPQLVKAQTKELEGEVMLEELQETLGAMPHRKTPGPNCLPVEFYRTYSASVLSRLSETLCEAHREGTLPAHMREALIVIIPKPRKDPVDPSSYRPLSILYVDLEWSEEEGMSEEEVEVQFLEPKRPLKVYGKGDGEAEVQHRHAGEEERTQLRGEVIRVG
ncbi:hypothetical protein NDU88_006983 [Pleurodeles waltl]|uniref:Uncharacterized protein n=1 Tax=Pleurodeles waltl TaxID=8319 RepID=A0AAV7VT44_PLEWA|nr:hypothetical protein NDU88_006983 [Pleurodeles waltl]